MLHLRAALVSAAVVCGALITPVHAGELELHVERLAASAGRGSFNLAPLADGRLLVVWSDDARRPLALRVALDTGEVDTVELANPDLRDVDDLEPLGASGFAVLSTSDDHAWVAVGSPPATSPRPAPALDVQTRAALVEVNGLVSTGEHLLVLEDDHLLRLDARGHLVDLHALPDGDRIEVSEPVLCAGQLAQASLDQVELPTRKLARLLLRRLDPDAAPLTLAGDSQVSMPPGQTDPYAAELALLCLDGTRLGLLYVNDDRGEVWLGEVDAGSGEVDAWVALDTTVAEQIAGHRLHPPQGVATPTWLIADRDEALPVRARLTTDADDALAIEIDALTGDDEALRGIGTCTAVAGELVCLGRHGSALVWLRERRIEPQAPASTGVWTTWQESTFDPTTPTVRSLAVAVDAWCTAHTDDPRCDDLVKLFTPPARSWEASDWTVLTDVEGASGQTDPLGVLIERRVGDPTAVHLRFEHDGKRWTVDAVDEVALPAPTSPEAAAVVGAVRQWCDTWSRASPYCETVLSGLDRETWAPARLRTRRPFRVTVDHPDPDSICAGVLMVHPHPDDDDAWLVQGIATDCPLYE